MGFFSELREDVSRAVNEMLPGEGAAEVKAEETKETLEKEPVITEELTGSEDVSEALGEETPKTDVSLDSLLAEENVTEETPETVSVEEETASDTENDSDADVKLDDLFIGEDANSFEEPVALDGLTPQTSDPDGKEEQNSYEGEINNMESGERVAVDETSIITAGMTINGDIESAGSLDVTGTIKGNIDIYGKLNVTGCIEGNSRACEVYADGARINGEINSDGTVKVGASSVVIGNISATSAVIAGAVMGDIDVHGPVILDASAIVKGNIKSKSVQINNGAAIEGMCSQCYADVNPTSFFDDYKKSK